MNYRIKKVSSALGASWVIQAQSQSRKQWKFYTVCGFPSYFTEVRKARHLCLLLKYPEDFKPAKTIPPISDANYYKYCDMLFDVCGRDLGNYQRATEAQKAEARQRMADGL